MVCHPPTNIALCKCQQPALEPCRQGATVGGSFEAAPPVGASMASTTGALNQPRGVCWLGAWGPSPMLLALAAKER